MENALVMGFFDSFLNTKAFPFLYEVQQKERGNAHFVGISP
jgi:hypothetical protein